MAELIARLGIAGAAVALGLLRPDLGAAFAGQAAALFSAGSILLFLLERRGMRPPGLSAAAAVLDILFIGALVARLGWLDRAGFAALAPMAWAASRHLGPPALMAPMAAAALLAAQNLFGAEPIGAWHAAAAAGVAIVGLLLPSRPRLLAVEVEKELPIPKSGAEAPLTNDLLEIRESYRAVRDHAAALELRSRKDRISVLAVLAALGPEGGFNALAKSLLESSGADGLTLYSVAQYGERMVVRSASGDVPEQMAVEAFEAPSRLGEGQLRHRIDQLVRTLRTPDSAARSATIILKHQGKVAGMACVFAKNLDAAAEAAQRLQESAETIGLLVRQICLREEEDRRRHEAEMLYAVASISAGADTRRTLAQRIVREMADLLGLDVLSLAAVQEGELNVLGHKGPDLPAMELLSFGFGQGHKGWLASGAPEVAMHDARADMRLDSREAIKRRIGSLVVIPISTASDPEACLIASSFRVGGIDVGALETLRMIAAELGHAFARIGHRSSPSEGMATPVELFKAVQDEGSGCLVYMEVLRRSDLVEGYGRAAVTHAIATFARRVKAMLPAGCLVCRRDEGDFVAYLRGMDERAAIAWANDAAATASMIGIPTPDKRANIPLAIRAKTAILAPEPAAKRSKVAA